MSQQTYVANVTNYYQSPLTLVFTDTPPGSNSFTVGAGSVNPNTPPPYSAATAKIDCNVPWYYYNNNNFQNHNLQVTVTGSDNPVIYIWQHGPKIYYSFTVPGGYTDGIVLWDNVGSPFALVIGSSTSADWIPTADFVIL